MAQNRRLIDANQIPYHKSGFPKAGGGVDSGMDWAFREDVDSLPTVDAVEVVRIAALKREILQRMDEFIAEYWRLSESLDDHFGGKAAAMEVARRLVNAALTGLRSYEAEPVRRGRWEFGSTLGHSWMKCSNCLHSQSGWAGTFSYCPNCGAKMDLEV